MCSQQMCEARVTPPYTVHIAELRKPSTPIPRWKEAELLALIALSKVERGAANSKTCVTLTAQPLCNSQKDVTVQ